MSYKVVISSLAMFLMLFVATLEAQERGRRGGGRGFGQQRASRTVLVRIEAVQKELEITDEQKEDLAALRGGGRQRGGGDQGEGRGRRRQGGEGDDANRQRGGQRERGQGGRGRGGQSAEQVQAEIDQLGEILLDHQVKRLNEIFVQVLGVAALQDPMVAKELDISDEQKEQMQKIQADVRAEMREMFNAEDREAMREKFAEMQEKSNKDMMGVLSDGQNKKLAEMKGEAFEMPEGAMRRGRGRGRGGDG